MRVEHIGDATLILADCMDIMRDMSDKSFDLAIVDPPSCLAICVVRETICYQN